MARIFVGLAGFAVLLLLLNLGLGFAIGDLQGKGLAVIDAAKQLRKLKLDARSTREQLDAAQAALTKASRDVAPERRRRDWHTLTGVAAALATLLVNSLTITYFIGTSRWCQEVVDTYQLDPALADQSRALKRAAFPWSLLGIVTILGVAALGALSDPGNLFEAAATWRVPHYLTALLSIPVISYCFWQQIAKIGENYDVIERILAEVESIRAAARAAREQAASVTP